MPRADNIVYSDNVRCPIRHGERGNGEIKPPWWEMKTLADRVRGLPNVCRISSTRHSHDSFSSIVEVEYYSLLA
jgi:hypothetical protein